MPMLVKKVNAGIRNSRNGKQARKIMKRINLMAIALLLIPAMLHGAGSDDDHGWWFSERFQGTSNDAGIVLKTNSTLGYTFNGHVQMYSGLPVYFTRASSSNTTGTTTSTTSFVNGIGNA